MKTKMANKGERLRNQGKKLLSAFKHPKITQVVLASTTDCRTLTKQTYTEKEHLKMAPQTT
ncbi:hypothetical protein GCM10023333_21480 [Ferrimonas pelagia]|uniref:Uncharacterized protein n=1 Tax=Ferrimonas pelagia TaxID=1177826 RepID=A0ABP9EUQ3_9GAMM